MKKLPTKKQAGRSKTEKKGIPQDSVLHGLMDYLNAAVHPTHVDGAMHDIGRRLAGTVLARQQALKSTSRSKRSTTLNQYLATVNESGWDSDIRSHSQDHIDLHTATCPFGAHAAENPNYCTLHSAMVGELALKQFGYAKVLVERGAGVPPHDCKVHVYTRESKSSKAAVGSTFEDSRGNPAVHRPLPDTVSHSLSSRELETLRLVGLGLSDKHVAKQMNISIRTAENHVARLREKLGVDSRGSLIRLALRHGLTDP